MSLSWRDGVATLLMAAVAAVAFIKIKGYEWPLINSWRVGSLALLLIGIGTCIVVGSGVVPAKDAWTTVAMVFGIIAFVAALVGIIFGSKIAFFALAADLIVLWMV